MYANASFLTAIEINKHPALCSFKCSPSDRTLLDKHVIYTCADVQYTTDASTSTSHDLPRHHMLVKVSVMAICSAHVWVADLGCKVQTIASFSLL